jgi:hypothetical protein
MRTHTNHRKRKFILILTRKTGNLKNSPLRHSKLLSTLWSVSSSLVPEDSSLPLSPLHTQQKFEIESNQKEEWGQIKILKPD